MARPAPHPRALAPGLLAALAACAVDAEVMTVPVQDARTVLVIAAEDDEIRVLAVPIDDPALSYISVPNPPRPGTEVFVLHYRCPIEALGLAPGLVAVAEDAASGRRLESPASVFVTTYDGEPEPSWSTTRLSPQLAELHLVTVSLGAARCARPRVESVALPEATPSEVTLAIAGPSGAAVVRSESGFFRVSGGEAEPLPAMSTSTRWLAGAPESGERILLVGAHGEVASADLRGELEPRPPMPGRFPAGWISLASGASAEVFAFTDRGTFARWDGASWMVLDERNEPSAGAQIAVAWIGPGEAVATGGDVVIRRGRDGEVSRERPAAAAKDERITAVASVTGVGVVAGSERGRFLLHAGDTWVPMSESPFAGAIRAVAPIPGGGAFLAADDLGAVARFDLSGGFCPASLVFRRTLGAHAVLEDGAILAAGATGAVDVARPAAPPESITCP